MFLSMLPAGTLHKNIHAGLDSVDFRGLLKVFSQLVMLSGTAGGRLKYSTR